MGNQTTVKPSTVIFDIDGTLANIEHRVHYVDGSSGKKDFNAFYDAMVSDLPNFGIVQMARMYHANGWHITICTGRPEQYRRQTVDWLGSVGIFYDVLRMRPDDQRFRPDFEIKEDMLADIITSHDILFAVDDRQQVVDMWRRNDILCLQVADGKY